MKQTDIAKSEDCPKKTANETTENKKTTGEIPKGKGRNVPNSKRQKGKGAKNNIKKVRKRLLKHTDIEKERRLPQKDSE